MTDDEYRPFVVERPGKNGRIKLGPEAKYWAEQHGMTLREMARHLLQQHEQGDAQGMIGGEFDESGDTPPTEAQNLESSRDILPDALPSELIEDRRSEPEYADTTMRRIWGQVPPALGPYPPRWPAPFGSYAPSPPLPVD
jgi:hypothetical protein